MAVPINTHAAATEAEAGIHPYPGKGRHRCVIAWSSSGMRVEYDIDAHDLILWVNPQAGKSDELRLRYFSCRDDNTTLFDRIRFTGLDPALFEGCDYDPHHMVLRFGHQRLHIAPHPLHPTVAIWSEGERLLVDIKADKQDESGLCDDRTFSTLHPDRGLGLLFVAALGSGEGSFWQLPTSPLSWRSMHTRATLDDSQVLILSGDLAHEPLVASASKFAADGKEAFLGETRAWVDKQTKPGLLEFADSCPEAKRMETLVDLNRRLMLSFQDLSGPIWDGPRNIYCHLWIRAGMNACLAEWAGVPGMVSPFARFALETPTILPEGQMFGQMFGPYTRLEEDGFFYVMWAQHCRWLQGEAKFDSSTTQVLTEALNWIERKCWDEERGLFGRYFACENTFAGARDDGWDAPIGAPVSWPPLRVDGSKITVRSYDVYINLLTYAAMRMLAPHVSAEQRLSMLEKCRRIDAALAPLWDRRDGIFAAPYGWIHSIDGDETLHLDGDHTDQVWGLTMPLFNPPSMPVERIRAEQADRAVRAMPESRMGKFLFAYTWSMLAADPIFRDPSKTFADFVALLPEIERSAKYFPMPGAVPECINTPDGDLFHDIRPCAFAVGQWIPVAYGLGIRRCACNWALRGSDVLARIASMRLGKATAEILWETSSQPVCSVRIDGQPLEHSLVLPLDLLGDSHHRIEVGGAAGLGPILVDTEASLIRLSKAGNQVHYHLDGYGPCRCRFADGEVQIVELNGLGVLSVSLS